MADGMDSAAFREHGKHMVDFVADYWDGLRQRRPMPDVQPMYIKQLMPAHAPQQPEEWSDIFLDLENVVVNANTHWHHPHFFAYYPTACSYQSIMADMLSGGLASIGFTWVGLACYMHHTVKHHVLLQKSSPSCTELEMVVMDWLAKMLQLPEHFHNAHPGPGAGMIQCTASDCTLIALLSARNRAMKQQKQADQQWTPYLANLPKRAVNRVSKWWASGKEEANDPNDYRQIAGLVGYTSVQSHSSVERAGLLAAVRIRQLATHKSEGYGLTGSTLETAILQDKARGNTPFFVCATVGTTNCCAFDRLEEIGKVCHKYGLWLHVDSAYAGSACICPEYRHLLNGIEYADSFNFNAHKWLLVNFDCAPMWFKDVSDVEQAFLVDPVYLKHDHDMPDFKNWQIPLGRRFRSLKLWFVLRSFGVTQLQQHIRSMCRLADAFGGLIERDDRFELVKPVTLGLVCFRLKGENGVSERLMAGLNTDGRIHLVPATVNGVYFLRLAICSTKTNDDDIRFAAEVIRQTADKLDEEF